MGSYIMYSIIIPMYNEEEVIGMTYERLKKVMNDLDEPYELIFVNDGSRDGTLPMVKEYSEWDPSVIVLDLSRNFGHQVAITAGMDQARGEAVVVIDADLQDPPERIKDMVEKWKEGYDVVYAKRAERKGETFFKKVTASMYYRLLRSLTDVDIPLDTGDFRLIDRKVCDQMNQLQEKNRFVRGLVSWVGFKQTAVEYDRDEREYGESKYPLGKMIKLSLDGITSFSYKPLKLSSYGGAMVSMIGFLYMIYVIYQRLFTDAAVPGWSSVIVIQLFFFGFVLLMLGIIGEYIGRIYDESKGRPSYIVQETYGRSVKDHAAVRSK
ncbi:glycosyltransferase [Halobacillus litoralis]|uniref:Glycosyltransferase n=1 Tax=Halobacillus litoralis TaxID=45668 RepID=A0A845DMU3_9BACI|nr:glycosyltransferase family 2 protein [Halobacillus litoralis]MYL18820.1 glycosyltransferase [Halobacillus litoralis]MYL39555.1 glycosyltransferase [Halobacillus litoralis]